MALVDRNHNVYLKSKFFQLDDDNKLCLEKVAKFLSEAFLNTEFKYEIKNYKEVDNKQIIDGHLHVSVFDKELNLYSAIGTIQIVNNSENKDWICYTITLFSMDKGLKSEEFTEIRKMKNECWFIQDLIMDRWHEISCEKVV